VNDPNARMCRGTTRAAKIRTKNINIQGNAEVARLSDLVVAVARFLFATDPALAALLAASPRSTLDSNVQVLDWAVTMDGGYVATEVMLTREGTPAGWVWARVGLGPLRVMGLLVGLEIKGPGEGSRTAGALVLLLRVVGHQFNFLLVHARKVRLGRDGRRRDGARWIESGLTTNDRALNLGTSGGGVLGH